MKKYRTPVVFPDSFRNAFPAIMAGALKASIMLGGYAIGRAVAKAAAVHSLKGIRPFSMKP